MAITWTGAATAAKVTAAAEAAVFEATEVLLAQSDALVPLDEGTLMNSGESSTEGLKGRVSYSTAYARKQHEDLDLVHPDGRTAKYLERPANAFGPELVAIATRHLGAVL